MISLFLDTCTSNIVVGVLKDDKVINSISFINDNKLSEKLLPEIKSLIEKSNISLNNLNKIFVSIGPGSFTGIRIGVTIAKVLAWSLKIDIVPVSSLEVMSSINTDKKYICPIIDARRGCAYTSLYDNELNNIISDKYINLNQFLEEINSNYDDVLYVSNEKLVDDSIIPNVDIEKIVNKHLKDSSLNPHEVNPTYLKLTEAEEKLNDKRD